MERWFCDPIVNRTIVLSVRLSFDNTILQSWALAREREPAQVRNRIPHTIEPCCRICRRFPASVKSKVMKPRHEPFLVRSRYRSCANLPWKINLLNGVSGSERWNGTMPFGNIYFVQTRHCSTPDGIISPKSYEKETIRPSFQVVVTICMNSG